MKKIKILLMSITLIFAIQSNAQESNSVSQIEIANSASEVCPIKIGEIVPSANIHNIEGELQDIRDVVDGKLSVLIFYRGGWCPYCSKHLSDIQSIENDIIDLGYQIIAISMDKPEFLKNTITQNKINYQLFSDSQGSACGAFGIAFQENDSVIEKLKSYNMDIEKSSGNKKHILPVPSLFIIDQNSVVKFQYVNPNYKERINSKLLLEIAKIIKGGESLKK